MIAAENPPTRLRVAYLGPEGSFAHLVARKRFGDQELIPHSSVDDVFNYLETAPDSLAVVPIENSSGGIITATVDRMIEEGTPFHIQEEISLNVKLALLGREGEKISKLYSHFAPFHHCTKWLKANYPDAEQVVTPSTTLAAIAASQETGSAALGSRESAERYGLDVIHYPVQADVPNITEFFVVAHQANPDSPNNSRTSLAVELPDAAGSLFRFLEPLARNEINLKRIESRPIKGKPHQYRFFIEIQGNSATPLVAKTLEEAKSHCLSLRNFGSYPTDCKLES
ncbi:MAG: prephenate dehydratase [Verrucomicrobiales bacterium]|nr:prephenate dehydratase [Verrucomicrobiales bacterium]